MSKYDADEWDKVTDYGWQLDMRRVIADIDARLAALEVKPAPQRRDCIICGKWYEDDGVHVCDGKPAPEESGLYVIAVAKSGYTYYERATPAQVRREAVRLGLLDTDTEVAALKAQLPAKAATPELPRTDEQPYHPLQEQLETGHA